MNERRKLPREWLIADRIPVREILPLIPVVVIAVLILFWIYSQHQDVARDLAGAASVQGVGTVTSVTVIPGGKSRNGEARPVFLELDGRLVNLNLADPLWANWLYRGQKVRFTYRVGHSGAWYIDQIAPAQTDGKARGE